MEIKGIVHDKYKYKSEKSGSFNNCTKLIILKQWSESVLLLFYLIFIQDHKRHKISFGKQICADKIIIEMCVFKDVLVGIRQTVIQFKKKSSTKSAPYTC